MAADLHLPPRPEEQELRLKEQELLTLESRLIERELLLATLKAGLAAFDAAYRKAVGALYAELDEIDAQISELLAAHEPNSPKAQAEAKEARARAARSRIEVAEQPAGQPPRLPPSESIKSLYREVAKRVHPDLAINDTDRAWRQNLMARANQAYSDGDSARLRAILAEYDSSPEAVVGEGTGVDLVRTIRKIAGVKRRLAEIDSETEQIETSELAELKKRVDVGTQESRDVLGEIVCSVKSRIKERQRELNNLRSSAER